MKLGLINSACAQAGTPGIDSASPLAVYVLAVSRLDRHEIAAFALTLGILFFAVITAVMLVGPALGSRPNRAPVTAPTKCGVVVVKEAALPAMCGASARAAAVVFGAIRPKVVMVANSAAHKAHKNPLNQRVSTANASTGSAIASHSGSMMKMLSP